MIFQGEIQWIYTVMLVAVRMAILFFATPLDGFGKVPTQIKLWVSIALSVLVVSTMDINLIVLRPVANIGLSCCLQKRPQATRHPSLTTKRAASTATPWRAPCPAPLLFWR